MTLLAPLGAIALLAIPAIVLLYFLKIKRPEVRVSTLMLWLPQLVDRQAWAGTSATCCTRAHTIVEAAEASGVDGLDPALLADFGRNPDPRKWSLTSNDESGRFTHAVDAPLRSASRADRVATASRSGSASLNIKPARVGSSTSARLSWSDASDVPGRQIGAEIGAEANGDVVKPLLFIG